MIINPRWPGKNGYTLNGGSGAPADHAELQVPNQIGYESWCSCGIWRAFGGFSEFESATALQAALTAAHTAHAGSTPLSTIWS